MEISCPQCEHRNPKDAKFCKECGLRLARSSDPLIGQKVGNHRLLKRIGVGGMGVVYLAEHVNLGKKYAVKFLHPQFASDEEVVERFRREAQVLAALDHENIIRENDFGWLDGVGFYLIMEYLEGETLKDVIRSGGPLEIKRIINIFEQLMDALDEAHSQTVIHRDLKPENIFLVQRRGRELLKILDFGIARIAMEGAHKDFTVDGEVYGSPTYMSPEQARGEISKVDHRADLYAAGIILVEVLTGRPPYQGSTPAEVMLAHISGLPPRLSDLNPDIRYAAGLEDVVLKALAKEADERFQSAREFWVALEPMLQKTLELQSSDDETVDIPPSVRAQPASSARVLVSREWTPGTASPRPSVETAATELPVSESSLAGVPIVGPASPEREYPAPTAEMQGLSVDEGTPAPASDAAVQVWETPQPPPGRFSASGMDTPAPLTTPPTPFGQPEDVSPSAFSTPAKPTQPPFSEPSVAGVDPALQDFLGEDDDEEATTVMRPSSPLPETPPKSAPPPDAFLGAPSSMVSPNPQEPSFEQLDPSEKTERRNRGVATTTYPPQTPQTSFPSSNVAVVTDDEDTTPPLFAPQPTTGSFGVDEDGYGTAPTPPLWERVLKHPAFLGGAVGFFLLLGLWMLLPREPVSALQKADAGASTPVHLQRPKPMRPRYLPSSRRQSLLPRRITPKKITSAAPATPRRATPRRADPPTAQKLVRLTITTVPKGAGVYIVGGGGRLATTPYVLQVPAGKHITIVIKKPGYLSVPISWSAKQDGSTHLRLVPSD